MDFFQEYFLCDGCQNRDFTRVYKFSIGFHGVNFSDELIYDEVTDETYQCTKCNKIYTVDQIKEGLAEIKKRGKTKF